VRTARGRRYRHGVDRRFLRPGWLVGHVLVFLAFLTCLRLGWWQWDRTHDADGTAQNLGYALLWPAFGAAFIYMWIRFLHLEVLKDADDDEETERDLRELLDDGDHEGDVADEPGRAGDAEPEPATESASAPPMEADVGNVSAHQPEESTAPGHGARRPDPQRPSKAVIISVAMVGEDDSDDPELTAYNQALAALAEEDRRRAR
jgi:hypothetical protein